MTTTDAAGFGATLRRLRTRSQLTQRQLATRAATHPTHVSRLESGDRSVLSRDLLERLGVVLEAEAELAAAAGRLPSRLEAVFCQYPAALGEDVFQARTVRSLRRLEAAYLAQSQLARTTGGAVVEGRVEPDHILRALRMRVRVEAVSSRVPVTIDGHLVTIRDALGEGDEGQFPRVRFLKAHAVSHVLMKAPECEFPRMSPGGAEEFACDIAAHLLCPAALLDAALLDAMPQGQDHPGAWASDTGTLIADVATRLGVSCWLAVRRLADEAFLDDEALYYSLGDRP